MEKYQREYSEQWDAKFGFFPFKEGWSPTNCMTTRLPFGHMYLQTIARKYDDTGVTDAISKYNAYVSAKKLTPSKIREMLASDCTLTMTIGKRDFHFFQLTGR